MSELDLVLQCSKPDGPIARLLAARGIGIRPLEAPEKLERFVLSDRLAIDRRTVMDFVNAIADKRLFVDAIELGESFTLGIVIVEGEDLYGSMRSFHPNAIRGALSALMIQYGLSVLRTADETDTAAIIAMMAQHEQQGVPEISLHPKRKAADVPDMQRRVVEMLPGAGLVVARALLQRFGSIERIVAASDEELSAVRGLGPKRVAGIRRVLQAEYEAIDTERDVEDAIARDPSILFPFPVTQIARQHVLPGDARDRWVPDMVYVSEERKELYIVELKRGQLTDEHLDQLATYLDEAERSELIGAFAAEGYKLRGMLASPAGAALEAKDARIEVRVLPEGPILLALKAARDDLLAASNG
jgi:ERCC4-type nuclease